MDRVDAARGEFVGGRLDPATAVEFAADPRVDRVVRGGGCRSTALRCRSAYRFFWDPGVVFRDLGFRVLLSFAPSRP